MSADLPQSWSVWQSKGNEVDGQMMDKWSTPDLKLKQNLEKNQESKSRTKFKSTTRITRTRTHSRSRTRSRTPEQDVIKICRSVWEGCSWCGWYGTLWRSVGINCLDIFLLSPGEVSRSAVSDMMVSDMMVSTEPCSSPTDSLNLLNETQARRDGVERNHINKTNNSVNRNQEEFQTERGGEVKVQDGCSGGTDRKLSVTFGLDVDVQKPPQNLTKQDWGGRRRWLSWV